MHVESVISELDAGDQWIDLELVNDGPELVTDFVRAWSVRIPVTGGPGDWRVMLHGFHSFSGSGSFDFTQAAPRIAFPWARLTAHNMFALPTGKPGTFTSSMFTTVCRADGSDPITVGTCDPRHHVTQVIATWRDDAIEIVVQAQMERIGVPAGARVGLPPVFVSRATPEVAQRRWAEQLAAHLALAPVRPSHDGYCSWYSHYTKITEQNLIEDLDAVEQAFGDHFELFHVDDGYQAAVGDWLLPDAGFPNGIEAVAHEVISRGTTAGLWLAPFLALARSRVAVEHPDWLLRNERGRPVIGLLNPPWDARHPVRALDVTHPGVLEYLHDVMSTMTGYGFGFFKLDFLYASMLPGVRHDASVTTLEGARNAMAVIRDAVGHDVFLMGCGCPTELGIGMVDVIRTSSDVTPIWRTPIVTRFVGGDSETLGTNIAHRNVLTRAFMNRVFFENDPDCLFAYRRRNRLTTAERRLMAHTNGLAGGPVMFATFASDCNGAEVETVELARRINREVRDPIGGATRWWSPDAMTTFHPELLAAAGTDTGWLAAANMAEVVGDRTVDLAAIFGWPDVEVEIIDAARADRVRVRGSIVTIQALAAHDSVMLRIRRAPGGPPLVR